MEIEKQISSKGEVRNRNIDLLPKLILDENSVNYDPLTGKIYISYGKHKNGENNKNKWREFSEINPAIRSCQHVLEKFETSRGEESGQVFGAADLASSTLSDFGARGQGEDNLPHLSYNTISKGIYAKYQRLADELILEEYFEKSSIHNMDLLIDDILNNFKISGQPNEYQNEVLIGQLRQAVKENLNLANIRVAPYLKPAIIVKNILFGNSEDEQNFKILSTQIADDEKTRQIMALIPLSQLHSITSDNDFYYKFSHRLRVCSSLLKIPSNSNGS